MRKFIALKNDVFYSIEQDGDETRFYANRHGTGYETRKQLKPETLPNKLVINEILQRPAICSEMSDELKDFLCTLEKIFNDPEE